MQCIPWIRSDVSRLRTLAVGLLDLGRPPVLDWRPTPPAEPALQVYESLRARAHNEGVTLEWSNEAGDGPDAGIRPDAGACGPARGPATLHQRHAGDRRSFKHDPHGAFKAGYGLGAGDGHALVQPDCGDHRDPALAPKGQFTAQVVGIHAGFKHSQRLLAVQAGAFGRRVQHAEIGDVAVVGKIGGVPF